ncbi:MAG: hypothetical protein A49_08560 [Methyloceanibacter sp.]|nr:MAG: hypothetical protein A49_08560 [Methyloceanibacter sp.]
MVSIKSNHTGPLALMGGPEMAPGKSIEVDDAVWAKMKSHDILKAWLKAGVIEVEGAEASDDNDDAEKDALIAELAKYGVEKNRRSSVETLKKALEEAIAAKEAEDSFDSEDE